MQYAVVREARFGTLIERPWLRDLPHLDPHDLEARCPGHEIVRRNYVGVGSGWVCVNCEKRYGLRGRILYRTAAVAEYVASWGLEITAAFAFVLALEALLWAIARLFA